MTTIRAIIALSGVIAMGLGLAALRRWPGGRRTAWWQQVFIAALGIGAALYALDVIHLRYCVDWKEQFYPAAMHWRDPWSLRGLYSPPWVVWVLRPFVLLGTRYSYTAWVVLTVPLALWAMRRAGAPLVTALLALLTPFYMEILFNGNIDVLVLVGYGLLDVLPGLGALLVLTKPHELALTILNARYRRVDLALVGAVFGLAFLLHGNWVAAMGRAVLSTGPQYEPWNVAVFPYGLLIAGPVAVIGWRSHDRAFLAAATPFASPYVPGYAFFPVLAILLPRLKLRGQLGILGLTWAGAAADIASGVVHYHVYAGYVAVLAWLGSMAIAQWTTPEGSSKHDRAPEARHETLPRLYSSDSLR
jgi:hypothetical protein